MANDLVAKGEAFRALHAREGAFVIPNPWDIGTTRILTGLGFEALATTSAGFAFSRGRTDGQVSRDAVLAHCREIAGATHLPVSADLEGGFADAPETVAETIRLAGETGLVGGSIEDATGDRDNPIYDFQHAVERVAAGVEAARSLAFPFTFTARAENFLYGHPDLDDTIARLQAFDKAGADVLYAPALRDLDQIGTLCAAVSKPVNLLMGIAGIGFSAADAAAAGVKRISLGSGLARAALGELLRASEEIQERGTFGFTDRAPSIPELSRFMQSAGEGA